MSLKLRVVVVDDSATCRMAITAALALDPGIDVVAQAADGREAVEVIARTRPDLAIIDVEMPHLDGVQATRELMSTTPLPIIIVSSHSQTRQAVAAMAGFEVGAMAVMEKPAAPVTPEDERQARAFTRAVRSLAQVKVVALRTRLPKPASPAPALPSAPALTRHLAALGIAASTGGPGAVLTVLKALPRDFPAPILVVQHISLGFVDSLATWWQSACALRVKIAERGEPLTRGTVYLPPDDQHLGATASSTIALSSAPPINGFRASATHLFESLGNAYGRAAAGAILTGIGDDGVEGLRLLRGRGGYVIAQDEATSAVYGMPKAAKEARVVDEVLPLEQVGGRLLSLVGR